MRADLHFHSYYSDGGFGVDYLVERAKRLKVQAAALTDHDTFFGCAEFAAAAAKTGIKAVSGIELSTYEPAEIHVLGYNVDYNGDNPLVREMVHLKQRRINRATSIIHKLNALGYDIDTDDIQSTGAQSYGRAHIARTLVAKGYYKTVSDVFERLLGDGRPAFVREFPLKPCEAVELITASGGVAVLAHPGRIKINRSGLEEIIAKMCDCGLRGIETFYPAHNAQMTDYFRSLANKHNIITTCGSDFHWEGGNEDINYELPDSAVKLLGLD